MFNMIYEEHIGFQGLSSCQSFLSCSYDFPCLQLKGIEDGNAQQLAGASS